MPGTTWNVAAAESAVVSSEELRERYAAYRRRQASRLVRMLPREAVRPLYRRARAATSLDATGEPDDPLAVLERYCERLLPLPPFETWYEDLARSPHAHLADTEESADAPTAAAPSTLDVRPIAYGGRAWLASLRSFREAGLWRGHIAFNEEGSELVYRTGTVFCEDDVGALHARFLSFDPSALQAFLRSALP